MTITYRIHPAIGIARVGTSPQGWFIGPESPGETPNLSDPQVSQPPNGRYKDAPGNIKRQAARFRVFEYDDASGAARPVREITHAEADITWKVRLANRKAAGTRIFAKGNRNPGVAASKLVIDAGDQVIQSSDRGPFRLQGTFQGHHTSPVPVPLGDLRTDDGGRLLVLGGFGKSFSPTSAQLNETFNNRDWCDDTSDGYVTATARFRDTGTLVNVHDPAWLLVGPPDFAPPIGNVIALYDIVYDIAVSRFSFHHDPLLAAGRLSFTRHIYPVLRRAVDLWWVESKAYGHAPGASAYFLDPTLFNELKDNNTNPSSGPWNTRHWVLQNLRKPDGTGGDMPKLNAEFDTGRAPRLTDWQYHMIELWAAGQFEPDWTGEPQPTPLSQLPIDQRPVALDRAALDACVGASFYPGIESPRILRDQPTLYRAPFRIRTDLAPGTITEGLAVPWQTDFSACGEAWWPAQRPNRVFRAGQEAAWDDGWTNANLPTAWAFLGFVKKTATPQRPFAEDERDPIPPPPV